jgi:hypothetical protein
MSATADLGPEWSLFEDWCTATGAVAMPATAETVRAFLGDAPVRPSTARRRLRVIRRAHRNARLALPIDLPERATTLRSGAGWADIPRALEQLPTLRYPVGLRGRRDGWLLVLIGSLGMTRREALAVTQEDVVLHPELTVAGRAVPRAEAAIECPACAVTRWLRIVDDAARGARAEVRAALDPTGVDDAAHDCKSGLNGAWRGASVLAPAIDRHGWVVGAGPLSLTAVSEIMACRQRQGGDPQRGFVRGETAGRFKDASSAELAAAYDDVDAQLAALLSRVEAAVSDGDEMLDFMDRLV